MPASTLLAIDQYGDFGVRENLVRLRAEQQARKSATAVRGHEDQAACGGFCSDDGCLVRRAGHRDPGCKGDAGLLGKLFTATEDLHRLGIGGAGELLRR